MKNIKSFFLALALILLNITFVQAHALVIDTGKTGKLVKIMKFGFIIANLKTEA